MFYASPTQADGLGFVITDFPLGDNKFTTSCLSDRGDFQIAAKGVGKFDLARSLALHLE